MSESHDPSAILEESHVFRIGNLRVKFESDRFTLSMIQTDKRDDLCGVVLLDRRQACALVAKLENILSKSSARG